MFTVVPNDANEIAIRSYHQSTSEHCIKTVTPPYRMPPQPPGASATLYGDAPIPGAAPIELSTTHISTNITLRTHSSKFPVSLINYFWVFHHFCLKFTCKVFRG